MLIAFISSWQESKNLDFFLTAYEYVQNYVNCNSQVRTRRRVAGEEEGRGGRKGGAGHMSPCLPLPAVLLKLMEISTTAVERRKG